MSELLKEAFKALDTLTEDVFSFDNEGIFHLDKFLHYDDVAPDFIEVIDPEASSEEELKPSYEGDAILECCVCGQAIYKNPKEVFLDKDLQVANAKEECPHCGQCGGFKVLGQVAPYVDTESTKVEVDGEEVEAGAEPEAEPLTESVEVPQIADKNLENYFLDVDKGYGWVTLEKAAEDLEMDEDIVAEWIGDHPAFGYTLTFEDIQIICCPHAPKYSEIMVELGVEEPDLLEEDFQRATVETGDTTLSMEATEEGKITVTSEPRKPAEGEEEEMIAPLTDETIEEIEADPEEEVEEESAEEIIEEEPADESPEEVEEPEEDEVDFEIDEIDESSLDELGESYFKRVYDNVDSFQTLSGTSDGSRILVEGLITFNSGRQAKTKFLFESDSIGENGQLKFVGMNEQLSRRKNAFTLKGKMEGNKLIAESFTYKYQALDSKTGKGYPLYGTVKTKKSF